MAKVKDKIKEVLAAGPLNVDEIISKVGAKPAVVKGLLTKMKKRGEVVETPDGKFKLP